MTGKIVSDKVEFTIELPAITDTYTKFSELILFEITLSTSNTQGNKTKWGEA